MKKILLSLATIFAVVIMTAGTTKAVFSSTATVTDNTFATGTLEIRVNGEPTVQGFSVDAMAPGDCTIGTYTLNNYGAPWFAGPSNLDAKELVMKVSNEKLADPTLFNELTLEVGADRGWGSWMPVYSGPLFGLVAGEGNLLSPRWTDLAHGNSEVVQYKVCLPADAGDAYQGLTSKFDFIFTGYTPVR